MPRCGDTSSGFTSYADMQIAGGVWPIIAGGSVCGMPPGTAHYYWYANSLVECYNGLTPSNPADNFTGASGYLCMATFYADPGASCDGYAAFQCSGSAPVAP